MLLFSGTVFTPAAVGLRRRAGLLGRRGVLPAAGRGVAAGHGPLLPQQRLAAVGRDTLDRLQRFKAVAGLAHLGPGLRAAAEGGRGGRRPPGDRTTATDRFAAARAVADAVLYEGYVLYPYRASARKNQVRWQFGVLVPRAFSEADGSERWSMRTECLVDPGWTRHLSVRIRCLQVQHRVVEAPATGRFRRRLRPSGVASRSTGTVHLGWDEAVDETVDIGPVAVARPGRP